MAGLHAYHPFPVTAAATTLTLSAAESKHLVRSLRAHVGEPIEAFDGQGSRWRGTVADPQSGGLVMHIARREKIPPSVPALALAVAIPKGNLLDDILRAAVELDAAAVFPLYSERCEVRLDDARAAAKHERWQAIAVEACKQSANPFLPAVAAPQKLADFLRAVSSEKSLRLVGSLEENTPPLALLPPPATPPAQLLVLIGPEGDFSSAEYAAIREAGFQGVRFGPHVLRVPTAAHYALAALDQFRQRHYPAA